MKIVVICGMSDDKVRANLLPLQKMDSVVEIFLIRRLPIKTEKTKVYSPPAFLCWSLILAELYRFLALISVCAREKPDFLYAIYFVPHGIYAAIVGSLFRIPVIQELIGTDRPKVAKTKCYQRLLKKSARIGVRGSASLKQLASLGISEEKFFVPTAVNVLDFSLFKPEEVSKVFDLIYCGRMDKNKQVDLLIRAVALTLQHHPDLKVVLVGNGPERAALESLSRQMNLEKVITFAGNQPYGKIPDFLNQSRLFMMASAFEGLPVAMIEALSCGLPVVVPDIGDISDVAVHGENAQLVKGNQPEEYHEAFSTLLGDKDYYHKLVEGALRSRNQFIGDYSLEKAKLIWEDVLSGIY